jgi:hypothetical protein
MKKFIRHLSLRSVLPFLASFMFVWHVESHAQILFATGSDAEVTEGGLRRVDSSQVSNAWVSEDLNLSNYKQIWLMPTRVEFREVAERASSARSRESALAFFVPEVRRNRFEELFGEEFHESLSEVESFAETEGAGRDVLIVRGFLTDVASGMPPESRTSGVTIVNWIWEVNYFLEISDSMDNTLLARIGSRERVEGPFESSETNPVTSQSIRAWTSTLARGLGQLADISRE